MKEDTPVAHAKPLGCGGLDASWREILDGEPVLRELEDHALDCRPCARALGSLIAASRRPESQARRALPLVLALAVLAVASLLLNAWLIARTG